MVRDVAEQVLGRGCTASETLLSDARCLVEPALQSAVDALAPDIREVASYHFGWQEGSGGGGKALRPALAFGCARAAGGAAHAAIPAAASLTIQS